MKKQGTAFAAVPFDHFWSCPARTRGGGYITGKIYLKVHFQADLGRTPTKSHFDFGSRSCRLCAIEASFLQQQLQHFPCINLMYFPLMPIFGLWDLRVQNRAVLPDELALFPSDLFHHVPVALILCVVQHIEVYGIAFALRFR